MKRIKKRSYTWVLLIVTIIAISLGYALLNTTININGKTTITENTWDIHFENIIISNKSVTAIKNPTIENQTTVDFEVDLNLPGDYYEFTVDIVNNGTIDAMIESFIKSPDLTSEQQKYLNYTIEYQNEEAIEVKQLVKVGKFVRVKVKVEYKKDIKQSDLPTTNETLNLGFTVNYQQADENGIEVKDNGEWNFEANGALDTIGTIVTIGTEKFYSFGTEGNNVKLLSMYNLYVGNECTANGAYSCKPYGEAATGMQNENMRGYISGQPTRNGTTAFSSSSQRGEKITDYKGSIVEGYVNNYKNILEEKFNVIIEEARLVKKEELTDTNVFACQGWSCTNSPYPWIIYTSYWTETLHTASTTGEGIFCVFNNGDICSHIYSDSFNYGVRPVIIISKEYFN